MLPTAHRGNTILSNAEIAQTMNPCRAGLKTAAQLPLATMRLSDSAWGPLTLVGR